MNCNSEIKNIDIKHIELYDDSNKISPHYPSAIDDLAVTIKNTGILVPPAVAPKNDKTYRIVSGFGRIAALLKNGFSGTIPCLVFMELSHEAELTFNIMDNLSTRKFNPTEIAAALKKISAFHDEKYVISNFLPLFQLAPSEPNYKKYISLNLLAESVLEELFFERLPLAAAFIIAKFDAAAQADFLKMIKTCRMGANIINEMAVNVFEASMQHSKSPAEILKIIKLDLVISGDKMNTNQKTEFLRANLLNLRRPEYQKALADFHEKISDLASNAVSVNPYPYFEKDEINISFSVKSIKDFDNKLKALNKIRNSKNIEGYISND